MNFDYILVNLIRCVIDLLHTNGVCFLSSDMVVFYRVIKMATFGVGKTILTSKSMWAWFLKVQCINRNVYIINTLSFRDTWCLPEITKIKQININTKCYKQPGANSTDPHILFSFGLNSKSYKEIISTNSSDKEEIEISVT